MGGMAGGMADMGGLTGYVVYAETGSVILEF